jgi:hypothetical protein
VGKEHGGNLPAPNHASERRLVEPQTEGAGNKMLSTGFFSGLATQSELDDLLDMLYGSYGERLIVSYKEAS